MSIHQHRVRFNEVDAQSLVFNSHYLTWCDHAIYELFRMNGWSPIDLKDMNMDLVLRTAMIDYQASARLDDLVDIDINVERMGNSSFNTIFYISHAEELLATIKICYINVIEGLPTPIPPHIKEFLRESCMKSS